VILLLLAFIFLRDKDLRRRINLFLSGAKRRMKRTQLTIRLKREKRRKSGLLRDLGRKAWHERLPEAKCEPHFETLDDLELQSTERQKDLKDALTGILALRARQEEVKKKYKELTGQKEAGELENHSALHSLKNEIRRLKRQIREDEKKIAAGQAALRAIDRRKEEEFESLGTIIDNGRPDHQEFLAAYVQIDKVNRRMLHFMDEIDKLR
jgi:chromosome segregation ATPase